MKRSFRIDIITLEFRYVTMANKRKLRATHSHHPPPTGARKHLSILFTNKVNYQSALGSFVSLISLSAQNETLISLPVIFFFRRRSPFFHLIR